MNGICTGWLMNVTCDERLRRHRIYFDFFLVETCQNKKFFHHALVENEGNYLL